jgi:hypothetical protein
MLPDVSTVRLSSIESALLAGVVTEHLPRLSQTGSGHACRVSVSTFARAAGEARMYLRVYEALGIDRELDLEVLSSEIGPLPTNLR